MSAAVARRASRADMGSALSVAAALPYMPRVAVAVAGAVVLKLAYDVAVVVLPLTLIVAGGAALCAVAVATWRSAGDTWRSAGDTWHSFLTANEAARARLTGLPRHQRDLFTEGTIPDRFESLDDLQAALRVCGLESSNLIVGVDFTASNRTSGMRTFGGRSLHEVDGPRGLNPYQRALGAIIRALGAYDEDGDIPMYGFGDKVTQDTAVFDMHAVGQPRGRGRGQSRATAVKTAEAALEIYARTVAAVTMSSPTTLAPLIDEALEVVAATGQYHILVVITDGLPSDMDRDREAVRRAADHALSIVCVGVGDGPFDAMHEFDDQIARRRFDNFQFVDFNEIDKFHTQAEADAHFALLALQEVPSQFATIQRLGLLRR
jgi:E3 ubiquitin-protein ligase RGLG